jgi:hypothetical protein
MPAVLMCCVFASGCDKASDRSKREYAMMVRHLASSEERCEKKREIALAYLKEGNEQEYQMANMDARIECNGAEIDRLMH